MNAKKLKKVILNINNKSSSKIENDIKFPKNISNRNNKLPSNSISFYNSSNNGSKFLPNKRSLHFSLSQNKYKHLNIDNLKNNNCESDLLKDNLIKTKEQYNEKNNELINLKLKYNQLTRFNRENLRLLYNIMKKAGLGVNNEKNIIDNLDISQILSKEEQETLKTKHLISCFKTKLFEYKNIIDKKDIELSKIKKDSRIKRLVKLENDNACKSLENINLTLEKDELNNKISSMTLAIGNLNNKCYRLKKSENKNMNDIGGLMNKIQNLTNEIETKDKVISSLTRKIHKDKEENKSLEKKVGDLENEIAQFDEDKRKCEKYLKEKENYEKNDYNMSKKVENLKKENEKLKFDLKKANEFKDELIIKYEKIMEEKEKLKLTKEDIKQKIKDKDKEIQLIDEKIKNNNEIFEDETKINQVKNLHNNDNKENKIMKELNIKYKEKEQKYLLEIDLLKQKILKLEEKNNLFNKMV